MALCNMRTKLKQQRESTTLNLLGENNPKGVLKPFHKYYLHSYDILGARMLWKPKEARILKKFIDQLV